MGFSGPKFNVHQLCLKCGYQKKEEEEEDKKEKKKASKKWRDGKKEKNKEKGQG